MSGRVSVFSDDDVERRRDRLPIGTYLLLLHGLHRLAKTAVEDVSLHLRTFLQWMSITIPGTSWRRACMPHRSERRSDRPSIPNGPAMSA